MSSLLLAWLSVSAAAATLVRSPYLQEVTDQGAAVLWTTSEQGPASLIVISPDSQTTTFKATAQRFDPTETNLTQTYFQYRAVATGLKPGTTYRYSIRMDDVDLVGGRTFQTSAPGAFSFLAMGDTGTGSAEQKRLADLMNAEQDIQMVLHFGDIGYPEANFAVLEKQYFAVYSQMMARVPIFPTPGNHEYMIADAIPYRAVHSAPESGVPAEDTGRYYSFNWGDAHFVSLDSNLFLADKAMDRMLAWLNRDLSSTRKFWKIVYFHHPPYPTGHHLGDPVCDAARIQVTPVLEKYGVQLVLGGHEHGYEKTYPLAGGNKVGPGEGTMYVISGGGGAAQQPIGLRPESALAMNAYHYLRVDVDGGKLTVRAIGMDGKDLDRFTLTPKPVFTSRGMVSSGRYEPQLAAGSLVTLFGRDFSPQPLAASAMPLPAKLNGVSVTVGDTSAPLLYVGPSQVNFQIPYSASGNTKITVSTPNGDASAQVMIAKTAPSIVAVLAGDSPASDTNPLSTKTPGVVYMVGLGMVPGAIAGRASSAGATMAPVSVWVDDAKISPAYAGLSPGSVGLYQVNFLLPPDVPQGSHALSISAGDARSTAVPLSTQ